MSAFHASATRFTSHPGSTVGTRPPVAGNRRAHDVERGRRIAPVTARVTQRLDDVEELRHRTRPAVRDDQRERVRFGRARVDEVDLLPVDVGEEVRPAVEPLFLHAPVELRLPVLAEVAEVRDVGAVRPNPSPGSGRASGCAPGGRAGRRAPRPALRRGMAGCRRRSDVSRSRPAAGPLGPRSLPWVDSGCASHSVGSACVSLLGGIPASRRYHSPALGLRPGCSGPARCSAGYTRLATLTWGPTVVRQARPSPCASASITLGR